MRETCRMRAAAAVIRVRGDAPVGGRAWKSGGTKNETVKLVPQAGPWPGVMRVSTGTCKGDRSENANLARGVRTGISADQCPAEG